jgi:hypothetical protein
LFCSSGPSWRAGFAPNTLVTPFCVLLLSRKGAGLFYVASIHRRRNESDMSVVMKERRPLQADSCQRSFLLHALSVDFSQDGVVGFFLSIQYQESFSFSQSTSLVSSMERTCYEPVTTVRAWFT